MKYIFLIVALLFPVGCSTFKDVAMDAAKGAVGLGDDSKGLEVDLDAQIGDRKNDVQVQGRGVKGTGDIKAEKGSHVQVLTKQAESSIERAESVSIKQQNIPPWMIIFLLMGWVLPDPVTMYRWLTTRTLFIGKDKSGQ